MSESSKVKTPKKGQSNEISFWYLIAGILMVVLVFSTAAVIISVSFAYGELKNQLKNYVTKDDFDSSLDSYTKKDDFDNSCDTWADGSDKVVKYADNVQFQAFGTEQSGFLINQQNGNAQFVDCEQGPIEPGDTLNFKVFKNTTGCSLST